MHSCLLALISPINGIVLWQHVSSQSTLLSDPSHSLPFFSENHLYFHPCEYHFSSNRACFVIPGAVF
ncbi:hypothetical protein T4B_7349 [Trichinella pseudospiralis]|uniref:Uncharacterized protein n=1 Tax=Trichinella pseudospiralis TaxID=6337 RepID=A0A0V1GCC6_TRIPS|nr:hypothetical protein T4B_7349 [Trichinella pseudospiralis]